LTRTRFKHEDFSVIFSFFDISDIEHFVARKIKLIEIYKALGSNSFHYTVILYGLGGIGKIQLSVIYAKRYRDSYSVIFWLNIKDEDSLK
jgi:hypothetical protein